jgi:hypothetical protein
MEASQKVIANFRATAVGDRPRFKGMSFFVDVAELWENYIYRLLKRHFIAGLEKLDNDISGKAALNRRKRKKRR